MRAAIIITACASLINFKPFFALRQSSPADAQAFAITCAATICCGAKWGLGVGVIASVGVLAYRATRVSVSPVAGVAPTGDCPLQISGWLNFANAATVERQIEQHIGRSQAERRHAIQRCVVHLDPAHMSDASGHHMLAGLKQRLRHRQVELIVS